MSSRVAVLVKLLRDPQCDQQVVGDRVNFAIRAESASDACLNEPLNVGNAIGMSTLDRDAPDMTDRLQHRGDVNER